MYVVFRAILNVTAVLARDLMWCKRIVVDIAFDRIKFFSLVSKDFEKCTASGSGTAKDNYEKLSSMVSYEKI